MAETNPQPNPGRPADAPTQIECCGRDWTTIHCGQCGRQLRLDTSPAALRKRWAAELGAAEVEQQKYARVLDAPDAEVAATIKQRARNRRQQAELRTQALRAQMALLGKLGS